MQKVLMMILKDCPHCHKALALMEELKTEHPEYGKTEVRIADESVETELAESLDYWYVPTFYVGDSMKAFQPKKRWKKYLKKR
ncbi:MAG: thioredoxin [Clostridiales bacterium]|nr:thioredoxin [Clostridiales bacterium]